MPQYECVTLSPTGIRTRIRREAATRDDLLRTLGVHVVTVVRLEEVYPRSRVGLLRLGQTDQLLEIVRALTALLRVGLSVPETLREAASFVDGKGRAVLRSVAESVEEGQRLSDALAHHPEWFDGLVVGVVRAGEGSGDLPAAFERLERKLERDSELRAQLFSALIYPTLLALVGGAAVCVLLGLVVPKFSEILLASGGSLPYSTRIVLAVSGFIASWWWAVLVAAAFAMLAAGVLTRPATRARAKSLFLLRCPGVAAIRRESLTAQYARMLGVLLGGGAPLSDGLRYCESAFTDGLARRDAALVRARVSEGVPLGTALADSRVFDPTLSRLVAAGEASGRLGDFVERAADFYERRLERLARRAVALVEPAMIVGFGIIVGFVALAVVQSIYSINAQSW